jgi:hypothetical protein
MDESGLPSSDLHADIPTQFLRWSDVRSVTRDPEGNRMMVEMRHGVEPVA